MSLFHASQQSSTIFSWEVNTRLESQLSRMNCQIFSTGLSSGHFAGSAMMLILPVLSLRVAIAVFRVETGSAVDGIKKRVANQNQRTVMIVICLKL